MAGKADYVYSAFLEDKDILKTLRDIEKRMGRLEKKGDNTFKKIAKSGTKNFSAMTGVITGLVTGLTNAVINMAKQGVRALVEIGKESIVLAKTQLAAEAQLEAVIASTGGAAGVTTEAAKSLATEMQNITNFGDEAVLAGENLLLTFTNIGEDIFPNATKTMLDMSVALKQDTKTSAIQLGKALNDPIKGISALQRVGVNFTESQKKMVEGMVESGKTAEAQKFILAELNREFGGSAEAARKADGGMIAFKNALGDLQEILGTGILAGVGDSFEKMAQAAQSETVKELAEAVGFLASQIISLVSSGFFDQFDDLDVDAVSNLAEAINDMARALNDIDMEGTTSNFGTLMDMLTALIQIFTLYSKLLPALGKMFGDNSKEASKFTALLSGIKEAFLAMIMPIGLLIGAFKQLDKLIEQLTGESLVENFDQMISEMDDIIGTADEDYESATQSIRDNIKAVNDEKMDAADTDDLTSSLDEAADDVETAVDKINDAIEKANDANEKEDLRHGRAIEDIMLDNARKQLDLELKFSQERQDLALDNNRAIEDIERKNNQAIEDAKRDLGREEKALAKKQSSDRATFEKASNKKLIQIEIDYRKQLQDIGKQYQYLLEDAAEDQDAIAFISAIKQRERAIEEAEKERVEKVEVTRKENNEQRRVMLEQQAVERSDLELAAQQKMADLQIQYDRELQENEIKLRREEADLQTSMTRRREALALDFDRRLADEKTNHERKRNDIAKALADEVSDVKNAEKEKAEAMIEEARRAVETVKALYAQLSDLTVPAPAVGVPKGGKKGGKGESDTLAPHKTSSGMPSGIPRFAAGGYPRGPSLVGEHGPEIFDPGGSLGKIIPNAQVANYLGQQMGGQTNNFNAEFSMSNPAVLSPEQAQATKNIAVQVAIQTYSRLLGDA